VILTMRATVLYRKVSHFSDELVKYNCLHRRREGACGGVQVKRHTFSILVLDGVSDHVYVVTALLLGKYPRS
jgi:hypothetical protein